MRLTIQATRICAALGIVAGLSAAADVVHFVNGDRLTGALADAQRGMVAIDVPEVGVVTVPKRLVAKVVRASAPTPAVPQSAQVLAKEPAPALSAWDVRAEFGLAVASGNTRTQDVNFVATAERRGRRFDSVIGIAAHNAKARATPIGPLADTKDQLDIDYDLRWKYRDTWYAVANVELFRDAIKNVDRRITTGVGLGNRFWTSERGALDTDVGVSQVFEQRIAGDVLEKSSHPALRWSLHFKRTLLAERLELFHSSQWLYILASASNRVWDSDTGVRLQLADRWHAGLRVDLQHETRPAAGRDRTDVGYAVTLGRSL